MCEPALPLGEDDGADGIGDLEMVKVVTVVAPDVDAGTGGDDSVGFSLEAPVLGLGAAEVDRVIETSELFNCTELSDG